VIGELGQIYRAVKANKLDMERGKVMAWILGQLRSALEAQHLERIESKLNQLSDTAQQRGRLPYNGHDGADQPARLPH
jgi:hypothetical protein